MKFILVFFLPVILFSQTPWSTGAIGDSIPYPFSSAWLNTSSGIQTWATLSGSTLKAAQCGFVSLSGSSPKTLQNIHIMIGAVTKTGGTDLRIGMQDVSTTTGPPMQPDGTWASGGTAYATVGDGSITANTWLRSGTVAGTLSVSNGDTWCIVVEPENYAGSDSYALRSIGVKSIWSGIADSYNGSAWSSSGTGLHLLEFTDGTYGSIGLGTPLSTVGGAVTYNSSSSPDEYALKITPSVSMSVVGMCAENPYSTATGDLDWVLYQDTTAIATVSIDANSLLSTSATVPTCVIFASSVTISAGSTYYAAIKPTTTNNVRIAYNAASDSTYWSVYGGGTNVNYSTRTDAGAWSDTDTRRIAIWLLTAGAGVTGGSFVVAQ